MEVLDVCIVQDHTNALKHIHKHLKKKSSSFHDNTILHLDSHPDLAPPEFVGEIIWNPFQLYHALDNSEGGISEWIIPLVACGHISKYIWIRPPWAKQALEDGSSRFDVGFSIENNKAAGRIRVTSTSQYYITENHSVADSSKLKPSTIVSLDTHVACIFDEKSFTEISGDIHTTKNNSSSTTTNEIVDIDSSDVYCNKDTSSELININTSPINSEMILDLPETFLLDIDLDYFSCCNPFKEISISTFGHNETTLIEKLFSNLRFKRANTLNMSLELHQECLNDAKLFNRCLEKVFDDEMISSISNVDSFMKSKCILDWISLYSCQKLGENLIVINQRCSYRQFYEFANGLSTTELEMVYNSFIMMDQPHHISTLKEIDSLIQNFELFLIDSISKLCYPGLVTIAVSSDDDYTPKDQVSYILTRVLKSLQEIYETKREIRVYYDDDVMMRV